MWQRTSTLEGGTGAVDAPGFSWRDRPAISRGNDRWLAGDKVAAPGLLSEVGFESGRQAAIAAAAAVQGRRGLNRQKGRNFSEPRIAAVRVA